MSGPYVFVLDWDGCIAGNVAFQSQYFSIVKALRQHKFKPRYQHKMPPAFAPNSKLIRPGFVSWMKQMEEMYQEVHFFIYTASEKSWAHQEIAWVEKLHGIKFARPIFTRDDCISDSAGNTRKSLAKVFPRIIKSISSKGRRQITNSERQTILESNLMIVDNNAVYTDRADKLLLCPDYGYCVFENLLNVIPKEARRHPAIQQLIYGLINGGYLCELPNEQDDQMNALSKQYDWLATKCKSLTMLNDGYKKDMFWKNLKKLTFRNQLKTFSPSIIKQLQNSIWRQAKASASASSSSPTGSK